MAYHLGLDLGTTYVGAALSRNGSADIVTLGDRSAVVPSVLFFKDDGEVLTGDTAVRRGLTEPTRLVREFKRRVGDTTPVIVGATPYSADSLTAELLRRVLADVTRRQGEAPRGVALTHPANWGPYKIDVLHQAIRMADAENVTVLTEPEAAAIHYAATERLDVGDMVAVYDLGGGTFDAAVLRRSEGERQFDLLGQVEGIERLGGVDFDEAIFQHAVRWVGQALQDSDPNDPATIQAVARLRQECVAAKEALSSDTEVSIPVLLPNLQTEVRLTRTEFEAMIRPAIAQTIEAMRRALRSAGVEPADLSAVLLVGGSSRIPLIAEMVGADLGVPIAVDIHPKHTVALGAAIAAAAADTPAPAVGPATAATTELEATAVMDVPEDQDASAVPAAPGEFAASPSGRRTRRGAVVGGVAAAVVLAAAAAVANVAVGGDDEPPPTSIAAVAAGIPGGQTAADPDESSPALTDGTGSETPSTSAAPPATIATVPEAASATTSTAPPTTAAPEGTTVAPTTTAAPATTAPPPTTVAEPALEVTIDAISIVDGAYHVAYSTNFDPLISGDPASHHIHFFFDDVDISDAGVPGSGPWKLYDTPAPFTGYAVADRPPGASQLCATVATSGHAVLDPGQVSCLDLPEG